MFIKLNKNYSESKNTYPVLINADNITSLASIEEGEEDFEFGARCRIEFTDSSYVNVIETIQYIASKVEAV